MTKTKKSCETLTYTFPERLVFHLVHVGGAIVILTQPFPDKTMKLEDIKLERTYMMMSTGEMSLPVRIADIASPEDMQKVRMEIAWENLWMGSPGLMRRWKYAEMV